jgi:phosphate acetyltransferase
VTTDSAATPARAAATTAGAVNPDPAAFPQVLRARARARGGRLVLAEGGDPRVRDAARVLAGDGIGVTLVGGEAEAAWARAEAPAVGVRAPGIDARLDAVAAWLAQRRPERVADAAAARALARDPLRFAAGLVALGEADAAVAGAVASTGDVLRAALWAIGPAPGVRTVSSSFYLVVPGHGVLTFADCAVVQYPSAEQLADIALAAARDRMRIVGDTARVALLSHATRGSAEGPSVERVREALARLRAMAPDLLADGELQADAALVPEVAARKAPRSALAGRANVLVFPDLDSGNIAYKLVQRLADAVAIGPIVQGLARPFCDVSRGATSDDIILVASAALLQSELHSPRRSETA